MIMPTEKIVKMLRKGMFSDTLLNMAADKIEELERQQPEWIDVNERLPENNERVLVYLKEKVSRYTQIDTDRVIAKKAGWVRWGDEVTHWMPLPKEPKPQ